MGKFTKKEVENALSKTIHPEINFSLIKLGMIGDIKEKENKVLIILKLPFLAVPIKEDLIKLVKGAVKKADKDASVEVKTEEMNEKERELKQELAWKDMLSV